MQRGKFTVLTGLIRLALVTAIAFLCLPTAANAQQAQPEIYVNMEVLEQLDPSEEQKQVPVKLRSPQERNSDVQPQLTSPAITYSPELPQRTPGTISAGKVSRSPTLQPDQPTATRTHPAVRLTDPLPNIPTPTDQEPVTFPIKTQTRVETSDPAASAISRPVPLRTGIAGNIRNNEPSYQPEAVEKPAPAAATRDLTEKPYEFSSKPVPVREKTKKAEPAKTAKKSPPIPVRKPPQDMKMATLPTVTTEPTPVEPEHKTPPVIPPQRPSNVQKASPELVAQLRAREASKKFIPMKAEAAQTDIPLPPPGPMGRKNMPAVAKPHVEAEELPQQEIKTVSKSDPLLGQLLDKDKEDLVATIESMVAEREDGKASPQPKKEKRQLGTNIVKAEPLQRPYNVYRPKRDDDKDEAITDTTQEKIEATKEPEDMKLASLPEASPVPTPPRPRSPDEKAFVTVPFTIGLNEIDDKITNEIETQLLPVLKKNPTSKLQIHAFASPAQDGSASARKASLARAMSVRAYLLSKGIEATRMNIRALGAESDREPMDRVDLIVFDPSKKS